MTPTFDAQNDSSALSPASGREPNPVSGTQYHLRAGTTEAVVASVGASLRVLRDAYGDLIAPFEADEMRPAMRGALLAPWPNRTDGGRYEFGGVKHQLPINEPELGNAAHGLAAWVDFAAIARDESSVTLEGTIQAQPGYPWRVRLEVAFELDPDGLTQRVAATNEARDAAPLGIAGHPYLAAGPIAPGAADAWYLEVPADDVMIVSPDRLLPTGVESVRARGGALDFRTRRLIGATELNHAFGGLRRDADGIARVRITDHRGFGVELATDLSCRWMQIYTTDAAGPAERRHAVAVEPMTCPPDALNSTIDLVALGPGESLAAEWRIRRITGDHP